MTHTDFRVFDERNESGQESRTSSQTTKQKMLVRLLLLIAACGVLVVSRVLIVQGDAARARKGMSRLPMSLSGLPPLEDGGAYSESSSSTRRRKLSIMKGQEQDAWAAAMDSLDGDATAAGSRGGGARGKLQALRKSVRSQFGEAAGGLRQLKQNIQSKRPRAALSSLLSLLPGRRGRQQRQQQEKTGLGSFAERLLRRFQREGVGKYGKYKGEGVGGMEGDGSDSFAGIDARYLPLLQSLEEEGHRALGNEEWHQVSDKENTKVWRRMLAEGSYGKEYPCLKLSTVVDAPAEVVMELLLDSGRVAEYNKYSKGRTDVEQLGPNTKIVRNRTLPPLQKKTHEFCTLMHVIKRPDGSQVMLTKYTDHPDVPQSDRFARSEIILGVTEVRPHPTDPNRAQFTTVSHVKSAGVPSFLAEKFSARGLTDFAESLRKALHLHVGREGREVEERKREKRERELQQGQREGEMVEVQVV